ncbi:hypothetical protein [Gallaecimonas sp. GXIMD1310]|uniref:hypothetical protein n=1 Tax=Gallaecimonas sp. GXIMD1310 TaxID=3131926 RepID=UPI003253EF7A
MRLTITSLLLLASGSALADNNQIDLDQVLAASQGVLHLNVSAGAFNQSTNLTALSLSCDSSNNTRASVSQSQRNRLVDMTPMQSSIALTNGSLSNNSGVLSASLIAGNLNQSANITEIGAGPGLSELDDSALSQQNSSIVSANTFATRRIAISKDSLKGNKGITQVTAISGNINKTSNHISINLP